MHITLSGIVHWTSVGEYLEEEIGKLPEPQGIHIGEKHFRKKITDAAKRYIPAGYIPEVRPNFPPKQLSLPMNVMHYVSLIQTTHV